MSDIILDQIRKILTKLSGQITSLTFNDGKLLAVVECPLNAISECERKAAQAAMA